MKKLIKILLSLLLIVVYLVVIYFIISFIGFDMGWNKQSYSLAERHLLANCFFLAWVPCFISSLISIFFEIKKIKIFRQDLILYCFGIASSLCFYLVNGGNPPDGSSILLCIIALITIYTIIFDVHQIFFRKPEEKQEEKLAQANLSKEKEDYQKEYFNSLDNK